MNQLNQGLAVIAGASLAGLMTEIALSRKGFQITILERSGKSRPSGVVLQADHGEADLSADARIIRKIASAGVKKADAWSDIEQRLRKHAEDDRNIHLRYNSRGSFTKKRMIAFIIKKGCHNGLPSYQPLS